MNRVRAHVDFRRLSLLRTVSVRLCEFSLLRMVSLRLRGFSLLRMVSLRLRMNFVYWYGFRSITHRIFSIAHKFSFAWL